MKKIIFFIVVVLAVFGFSACKQSEVKTGDVSVNKVVEVQETGTIVDLTNENNKIAYVNPGDVLVINFIDAKDSKNQWSFRNPMENGIISLKEHSIITEKDSRIKEGETLNEWKFKVLKEANFEIVFSYENAMKPSTPLKYFRTEIISAKKANEIPDIIVNSPKPDEAVSQKFQLNGYSKSDNKTLQYKLMDAKNATSTFGLIIIGNDSFYFEKSIDIKKANAGEANLIIFQINPDDNSEYNSLTIPITINKSK